MANPKLAHVFTKSIQPTVALHVATATQEVNIRRFIIQCIAVAMMAFYATRPATFFTWF
jgi:Na+/proline symporter